MPFDFCKFLQFLIVCNEIQVCPQGSEKATAIALQRSTRPLRQLLRGVLPASPLRSHSAAQLQASFG